MRIQVPFFFATAILIFFGAIQSYSFDNVKLLSTPEINAPVVKNGVAVYSIDFVFNHCPQEYFLYYDRFQRMLVIDFYRAAVSWADSGKAKLFSGEIIVRNVETAMSLSGQKGQISFTLQKGWNFEQGWHFESSIISPSTLRVKLWIELRPAIKEKSKNKR
jgi:hypothetical protein